MKRVQHMLYDRRIQAPPGGARRQDHAAQFRPRPALSDHQRLSRPVMTTTTGSPGRRPLRAVADRAHPYRQCPHGDPQLAVRAASRAAGSCCASTTPIASARPTNLREAIAADLAWLGIVPDLMERQSERFDRYDAGRRAAQGDGPPLSLLRDARGTRTAAQAAAGARRSRRSTTAPRLSSARPSASSSKREGGGRIGASSSRPARSTGTTWSAATQQIDTATLSDPVLVRERRQLSLHPALGGRRHRFRHHPCHPRRGSCRQHRGADRDLRGARGQARRNSPITAC